MHTTNKYDPEKELPSLSPRQFKRKSSKLSWALTNENLKIVLQTWLVCPVAETDQACYLQAAESQLGYISAHRMGSF